MKRKILSYIMAAALLLFSCAGMLSGCSKKETPASAGYAFVDHLVSKDYSGAYDYVYALTSDVQSRDDFVSRYTNIYEALEITDITLLDRSITEKSDNESTLSYTLQMESGLLGTLTYDFSADIVAGPQGYTVLYMPNLILPQLEEGDKVRTAKQTGARGEIFSADGMLLAKNDFAQSIYIDFEKSPNIDEIKSFLQSGYGLDPETIQKKYDNAVEKGFPSEVLASYPKGTLSDAQKEAIAQVSGLGVDEERMTPTRYYPLKDNAAHIIGYLGSPDEEQLEAYADAGITESSTVGKTGLERIYEETLRGTDGKAVYIEDEKGNRKETLYEDAKTDGSDVTLTIDSDMQNRAYTLMAANLDANESGAVVVMDYATGAVEASVSYPSFDNNLFNFPLDQAVVDHYMGEDSNSAMYNRVTQSTYTPGSIFKPFSAVPAIEAGILTADSVPSLSRTMLPNGRSSEWQPREDGWDQWVYPKITTKDSADPFILEYALKSSDNIFFAYWAMKVGIDDFKAYLERIGIGEAPSFELPVTASSMIRDGSEYTLNWLALTGFGTNELQISPLQMACMYTAYENGGNILNPTILKNISHTVDGEQVIDQEGQTTVFKENAVPQNAIDLEMPGLRAVMSTGTAARAGLGNANIYGKTGTAPFGPNNSREWNWIVAINNDDGLIYLVIVESDADFGTQPKLNILAGLVDETKYDDALQRKVVEE